MSAGERPAPGGPGSVREEAERLVAAALAAAAVAAQNAERLATGSAECCACPFCRAIAAVRDPDPRVAERLATGVGDLAEGIAGLLRAFGSAGHRDGPGPAGGASKGGEPGPEDENRHRE